MIEVFSRVVAGARYLFMIVAVLLLVMAVGSFAGALAAAAASLTGPAGLGASTGIALISGAIRAGFLYFLAVAFTGLFIGDVPAPQWMTVRNLHQFRTKVLTFVSIILPLAFMGRFAHGQETPQELLYAGGAVFLVLSGIFLLVRFGPQSGDESQAREGNRVPEGAAARDRRAGRPQREGGRKRERGREGGRHRDEERLEKQKEDLKFEKKSLPDDADRGPSSGGGSHVTVRPGPKRPRRR